MQFQQWILSSRPTGRPISENFSFINGELPDLQNHSCRVRILYISIDPYLRGRMRNVRSYVPPFELNKPIESDAIAQVLESRHPEFTPGQFVRGKLPWQDFCDIDGDQLDGLPNDPSILTAHLGILGMTGLTAYFGLLHIGQPKKGETIVVSGAAGAVGTAVGQIAKIKNCRAVGIAGSEKKIDVLKELGFDAGVNYKNEKLFRKNLKDACPNGIDIYFDNVGGFVSDTAITLINRSARIPICGQISIYNREKTETGPRQLLYLVVYRARMEGFLVHDFKAHFPQALSDLTKWFKEGRLKNLETVTVGLEKAPAAFAGLFDGLNTGKQLIKVADPMDG